MNSGTEIIINHQIIQAQVIYSGLSILVGSDEINETIIGIPGPAGSPGTDGLPGVKGNPGTDGIGVPVGGASGQILKKQSPTDFDTSWQDEAEGSVKLSAYTASEAEAAVSVLAAYSMIYVTDEVGGATVAISDGTDFRRLSDMEIIAEASAFKLTDLTTSILLIDPRVASSRWQNVAGTIPANDGDNLARLDNLAPGATDYLSQSTALEVPTFGGSPPNFKLNGTTDNLNYAFPGGSGPALCTIFFVFKNTDTKFALFYREDTSKFLILSQSGNTAAGVTGGAGSPTFAIDNGSNLLTRDEIFTAGSDGVNHIGVIDNCSLSLWAEFNIGNYANSYQYNGDIGPILIIPNGSELDANRDKIITDMANGYGIVLP